MGLILPTAGNTPLQAAVAKSALDGAKYAEDDFQLNAELVGIDFKILRETASGAGVTAAADKLLAQGAFGIMGGFTYQEAKALADWSKAKNIPFINLTVANDLLRNEQCVPTMFHMAPSAAMYLDALAGWYVRSNLRQWYIVYEDTEEGRAQYERLRYSVRERHFGAREVGATRLAVGAAGGTNLTNAVRRANADAIFLLMGAEGQLRILAELDKAGITAQTTGFPYPEAQMREFYALSAKAAPTLGTGHRTAAWEGTIDAYGAREWNARYQATFDNEPLQTPAWAIYHAVKTFYESAVFGGGSTAAADIMAHMNDQGNVFDLHKGLGSTFRPWDRQLRQSLYLVKINGNARDKVSGAILVGELPAIYMPGTDLIERLDQLGDLPKQSKCR
jgi:ABC transporter substrate binding protein (PQQ-dependent alcohol dehydrogenase system)